MADQDLKKNFIHSFVVMVNLMCQFDVPWGV